MTRRHEGAGDRGSAGGRGRDDEVVSATASIDEMAEFEAHAQAIALSTMITARDCVRHQDNGRRH
jgi:hypothetical protein